MNVGVAKQSVIAIYLLLLITTSPFVFGQQNSGSPVYPFPQDRTYAYGFKPTTVTGADATAAYNSWKSTFVENCNGTWRVKFDNTSETVSEGIAYGMLLAVFHADKPLFDGLWQYYKDARNGNGVMNWKRGGCANTAIGNNGATDAELDAAFSLIIANCQWPNASTPHNYKSDATALINIIKTHEVESGSYILKPGDQFGGSSITNPSYFSPAYYRVFADFVPADAPFWNNVITKTYQILSVNAHSSTGLVSDWCNGSGTPGGNGYAFGGTRYHYDAARTPWRIATDYVWWGDANAKAFCDKITTWVNGPAGGIANIGDSYEQNGTKQSPWHNSTFVGAFAAGAMTSSAANANSFANDFKNIPASSDAAYFQRTLRALYYLLLSGNFWYPCNSAPPSSVTVSITTPTNNANYSEGDDVTIAATASTTSGSISKVEFFNGNTKLGEDLSSPYSFTWNNVPAGSHSIKAVATSSASEIGQAVTSINVYKAVFQSSAPTIDGAIDALWGNYSAGNILKSTTGNVTSSGDLAATWKAVWDNTNIYVLVQVTDDIKRNDAGTDVYNDDAVEIYFDIANNKPSSYGTNDFQYTFRYNDPAIYASDNKSTSGITLAQTASASGYIMEIKIPWATLTNTASVDQLVGFDVHVNDDDDGGERDGKLAWNASTDDAWQNPSLFGTIILKGATCTTPGAAATITGPSSVCANSTDISYSIPTVSGATSYNWILPNGATVTSDQNANSIKVSWGSTGGNISVTPMNACGNGTSRSLNVSLSPAVTPSVSVVANSTVICSSQPVTFTATPTNGGANPTYQWQRNSNNITGATGATYTTSTISNGDKFKVVMTSSSACKTSPSETSNEVSITVNPTLTASVSVASTSSSICAGASITLTASPINGGADPTYQWQRNGNNITGATSSTYTTSTVSTGDKFRVIMTSNTSCASGSPATSNQISITVNSAPVASVTAASNATTICSGEVVTFTASPVNGGANPSYQWQRNGNNITGATGATYTTSTASNGDNFRVVMTSNAACVTGSPVSSNQISINVRSTGVTSVAATASSASICSGESVTFTASPVNGGTTPTYQWVKNGNNITGATNATYSTTSIANGDKFSVVMTSNSTCASGSPATSNEITMAVSGSVVASVTVSSSSSSICTGQSVTFTAAPINGGTAPIYQWQRNGSNITGATSSTYTTSSVSNNDKFRVVMTSNSTCVIASSSTSNEVSMNVSSSGTASVSISSNVTTVCSGQSAIFTANPINGGNSPVYQWQRNGNNITGATSATYSTGTISNGDNFRVTMISNAACVTGSPATSDQIDITVSSTVTPATSISASSNTICEGEPVTFSAMSTNPGTAPIYQWQKNGINISGANTSTYTTSAISDGDKFRVILTSNASCVSSFTATSNEQIIRVNQGNGTPVISISADKTSICTGEIITFTSVPVNGGTSPIYQWQKNGVNIPGANAESYSSTNFVNGDKITLAMTTSSSCVSNSTAISNQLTIAVSTPQVANAGADQTACSTTASLNGNNPGGGATINWALISGSGNIVNRTRRNTSVTALGGGENIIVYMISSGNCTTHDTIVITSIAPTVTIQPDANPVCAGTSVTFTATGTNGGNTPIYQWTVNGQSVGGNSSTYTSSSLADRDIVRCAMTSSMCNTSVNSNSYAMKIDQLPTVADAGPDQFIKRSSTFFQGNNPINGTGTWGLIDGTGTIINASSPTGSVLNLESGANIFSWTISNGTCPSTTDYVIINVGTNPDHVAVEGPTQVVVGETVTYTVPENSGSSYHWSVPPGANIVDGQGTNTIVIRFDNEISGDVAVTETNPYGSTTSSVTIDIITFVAKARANFYYTIYPNPFQSNTILNLSGLTVTELDITVSDINGIQLQQYRVGAEENIILGEDLNSGVYFVQVSAGEIVEVIKVVKIK